MAKQGYDYCEMSDILPRLEALRTTLKAKRVPTTGKIDQLIKNLDWVRQPDRTIEELSGLLGRSLRELLEAFQLCDLQFRVLEPGLSAALPGTWKLIMVDGSDLQESRDRGITSPRDFQYELWLAARFQGENTTAVWSNGRDKPDLKISMGSSHIFETPKEFLIQAKRPNKLGTVKRNILAAANQISKNLSSFPNALGLIAICLDLPLIDQQTALATGSATYHPSVGPSSVVDRSLTDVLAKVMQGLREIVWALRKPRLAGVLFTANLPMVIREPGVENKIGLIRHMEVIEPAGQPYGAELRQLHANIAASDSWMGLRN